MFRLALAAVALQVALGQLPMPSPRANCQYTPTGFTAAQIQYSLEYFAREPHIIYDDRNFDDNFLYQVAFCGNVPKGQLADPGHCYNTRSMVNETGCTSGRYSNSAVYQFYKSGIPPTPLPPPLANAPAAQASRVEAARPESIRPKHPVERSASLSPALRDSLVVAARRGLTARPASIFPASEMSFPRAAPASLAEEAIGEALGDKPCYDDRCWRVAGDASVASNTVYSALAFNAADTHHVASGMSVSLKGGDACWDKDSATAFPRQMNIHLICSPQFGALTKDALVVETTTCQYEVVLHTVHACPLQCLPYAADGSVDLCGGNGVCNFDSSSSQKGQRARCFCFTGWSGDQCTVEGDAGTPVATDDPLEVTCAFFGSLFAGLVVAGGVFYYFVYIREPGPPAAPVGAAAPTSSGPIGGLRAMFGGSSGAYAPPTPEGGAIPGIDDGGAADDGGFAGAAGGDDDADNPML